MTVRLDHTRRARIGLPEAIFCEGKDLAHLVRLVRELAEGTPAPCLLTRMSAEQHAALDGFAALDYDPLSRTAFLHGRLPEIEGRVNVVTAGTADLSVAAEACRTLEFHGISPTLTADVGVAGLWRLLDVLPALKECDVLIAVAGMDAALVSVLGGLVGVSVIGVPTSVGYGVVDGGRTALNAMLVSCAQGIVVTNIDNGFGAACAALRIVGPTSVRANGTVAAQKR